MTKKELLEDAQLLEVARKKASRKAMLAESEPRPCAGRRGHDPGGG